MTKPRLLSLISLLFSLLAATAAADPYVGQFSGEFEGRDYRVTIEQFSAGAYDGILQVGDEPMQLDARRYGEYLNGLLRSETERIGFRARLQGDILVMDFEDGRRIVLWRNAAQ